jgi:TonB-dependent starch-binding outer membrane protein SusC
MAMKTFLMVSALCLFAFLPGSTWAQTGTISGTVVDAETGDPLPGANVAIIALQRGAATDLDGRFEITNVPYGEYELSAQFIGFRRTVQRITLNQPRLEVELGLSTDLLGLDEVVVVGYGTQQRRNIAGAISSLRPEQIRDVPTPSIDNALQGRVAGVQVTQNSGNPGSALTVRVRGATSITAGNEPLYVIDGVPVTQGNFSGIDDTFGGQGISSLSDINPADIESIEVLKDASAAAIYGSRASNGVVLITTRRGREGAPQINFNSYYGIQSEWNRIDLLSAEEYVEVMNEGRVLDGAGPIFEYDGDDLIAFGGFLEIPRVNTNWLDETFRTAPISQTDLSVSGGTQRVRYYVSGTYYNEEGIVQGFSFDRMSGRINLDFEATSRLNFGTNVALTRGLIVRSRGDNTLYGPFANAIAMPPIFPIYDEDGGYYPTNTLSITNAVGLARENEAEERTTRIMGDVFANYRVMEGMNAQVRTAVDNMTLRSRLYDSPIIGLGVGTGGTAQIGNSYVTKVTLEGTLNYVSQVGNDGFLSGVVGTSVEDNTTEYNSVTGQQFPTEFFRYITSAASITGGTSSLTGWNLASIFGRTSYTHLDRYTLTVNARTDGSSRFGADNRWGFFPSASVLWRVSEEAFMQDQAFFGNLALRASYGVTGNQFGIGNFDSRGLWGGGANYNDLPGISPTQLENPELRWEQTDQFNVGADLGVIGDRLSISGDFYVKRTRDLLLNRPIPSTTGFTVFTSNIGNMENVGFDLALNAHLVRGPARAFNWTADFNISHVRNRVTALFDDDPISFGFSGSSRIEVDQPLGVFYGYRMDGIFQSYDEIDDLNDRALAEHNRYYQNEYTRTGDIRFRDLDGDGIITADDREIIGSPWPDFTGGLTSTMSFGGFDVRAFFSFSLGNDVFNAMRQYTDAYGFGFFDNNSGRARDRWTEDNPSDTEPRASYWDDNNNVRISDRFIEDGSYVRLKDIVLGYTLPQTMLTQIGARSLRVYLQAQNLVTLTGYSGFDPEVNFAGTSDVVRGVDFYTLPQARRFTVGVNLGL